MGDFGCGDGGWTPVMKIDGNKVGLCCENFPSKGLQTNTSLTNMKYRIQVSLTTNVSLHLSRTNACTFSHTLTFKARLELRATAKYFGFRNEESWRSM